MKSREDHRFFQVNWFFLRSGMILSAHWGRCRPSLVWGDFPNVSSCRRWRQLWLTLTIVANLRRSCYIISYISYPVRFSALSQAEVGSSLWWRLTLTVNTALWGLKTQAEVDSSLWWRLTLIDNTAIRDLTTHKQWHSFSLRVWKEVARSYPQLIYVLYIPMTKTLSKLSFTLKRSASKELMQEPS